MTHFVGLVVADSPDELPALLEKYDENRQVEPYFQPLDDLDSMAAHYKVDSTVEALLPHVRSWTGKPGVVQDGKLGYMSTYNPDSTWDWYVVGGRWANSVPGDVCLAKDVDKHFVDFKPSVIVDADGWHASTRWGWWASHTPIDGAADIVERKLKEHALRKVYVVDFHI